MRNIAAGALLALFTAAVPVVAQDAAAQPAKAKYVSVIGTVQTVDAGGKALSFKTDKGETPTIKFDDKTQFLRLPAGETDTKKATRAAAGDVTTGDRAIARLKAEDSGAPAVFLYFTKQTDLAQRQKKTDDEWQTQSVNGTVKSVDAAAKQIVASVRGGFGPAKDVTLDATGSVEFLRFSLDTGKYEPSTAGIAQIQSGDQVRLLGQKNADQTQIKLEAIMSGTFKSVPVQVKSVDTAAGAILATDLVSKMPVTISIKPDTLLKRLDDATALAMARRLNPSFQAEGGGRGGRGGRGQGGGTAGANNAEANPDTAGQTPGTVNAGAFGGGAGRGGRGGGGGRNGDPNKVLDQQPSIELADLKPGEPIVVTGAPSADLAKMTAVSIVAGVDPILRAAPQKGADPLAGNWNFGGGNGPE